MDSFSQAPDYASALERTFQSYNASLDRKEAMERENDQRRIQNAGMPLEVIKGLVNFSVTAKNFVEERENKKMQKAEELGVDNRISVLDDEFEDTIDLSKDLYSKEVEVEKKALENGDLEVAQNVQGKIGHLFENKHRAVHHIKYGVPNWFISSGTDKKLKGAKDRDEALKVIQGFETKVNMVAGDHLSDKMIEKYITPFLAEKRRELLNIKDKQIAEEINTQRFATMKADLGNIFQGKPDQLLTQIADWKKKHKGAFNNDKEMMFYVLDEAVDVVDKNEGPPELIEMLLEEQTIHKGTGKLTPVKEIMKQQLREEYEDRVEQRKKANLEKNLESIEIKRKEAGQLFKKEEQELLETEGRRFTEDEIKEKIKQWRATSVHPIPEEYKTALSVEDQVEEGVVDRLVYKYAEKIPIYEEDLIGLRDPDKIRYWRPLQQKSDQWAIPQNIKTIADGRIDTITSKWLEETTASKDKSDQWKITRDNAKLRYLERYEYYSDKESTPLKIHDRALADVKAEILNGDHDAERAIDPFNRYALNIEMAHSSIAANKNIITTAVIPGTQEALQEAIENPNTIPKMYKDIASKYKTMSPADLMYAQLEAAGNKVKKDPVTEQVEKLDPDVRQLLNHHPTHGRVARALLKEYQKDGEITYDDVEFLLEEVKIDQLDAELKRRGITTPELGALTPQQGDWQTLENGTYVLFDGNQWKQVGFLTTNREPYIGNIDEYLDKDLINRKF